MGGEKQRSGKESAAAKPGAEPDSMPPNAAKLNDQQRTAFEKFKQLAEEKKLYKPASTVDGKLQQASHDDTTLLRYLRARLYEPVSAVKQFEDTEIWRKDIKLDAAYDTMEVEEFETARRVWTGRRDKRGIPLFVYVVSHLGSKELADYNKGVTQKNGPPKPKLMKLYAIYESLTQFVLPICSLVHPDKSVPCTSNIVDISNVGLWTFWNLKGHMQDASTLATAHYPETLDRIFIIGAPSFFSTVWGWIKKWFDPITVSKMYILAPHEVTPTLLKFIDIENIPKAYGGKLDWSYAQPPVLDDEVKQVLGKMAEPGGWKGGPIRYVETETEARVEAVGSLNGSERKDVQATIPLEKTETLKEAHTDQTLADAAIVNTPAKSEAPAVVGATKDDQTPNAAPETSLATSEAKALVNGVGDLSVASDLPEAAKPKDAEPIQTDSKNALEVPASVLAPTEAEKISDKTVPLSAQQDTEPVLAFEPEKIQAAGVYPKSEPDVDKSTPVQA